MLKTHLLFPFHLIVFEMSDEFCSHLHFDIWHNNSLNSSSMDYVIGLSAHRPQSKVYFYYNALYLLNICQKVLLI